jgi:hypothetical protein
MLKSIWQFIALAALCFAVGSVAGQPPVGSNAPPAATAAEEAYNLSLVVQKIGAHVAAGDLTAVLGYDYVSMKAFQFLLYRPALARPGEQAEIKTALTEFSTKLNAVRSAARNGRQRDAIAALKELNEAWARVKELYPPEFIAATSELSTRFFCPAHADVSGRQGERCSKCGRTLQRMDEFCGLPSSDPILRASARTSEPLTAGQKLEVTLQLTRKDGAAVRETDLLPTHTERLHLFAIDSTLSDYHHEHPRPSSNPGEYIFGFTPKNAGAYRIWLDLLPLATRREEMPSLDLGRFHAALLDRTLTDVFSNASWRLKLAVQQPSLRAGFPGWATLVVTDLADAPCTRLEPIMANFAHFVGFHEDGQTVYHLHAAGLKDVIDPTLRSGPEVQVYLPGLKRGFIRLFAQI